MLFKIKDMTDAADFSDAEEAALRRRRVDRPQTGRGQGGRPAPQGGRTQGGQKVMHEVGAERRPAGKPTGQGGRPAGQQARPATQGARPTAPQAGRPTPQGTRPAAPQTGRPAPQVDRPVKPAQNNGNPQDPGWKSKNFMSDDDEFEFEFLNWDGDEEQ